MQSIYERHMQNLVTKFGVSKLEIELTAAPPKEVYLSPHGGLRHTPPKQGESIATVKHKGRNVDVIVRHVND